MNMLTVSQAAERLGVSKEVVYQLCSKDHAAIKHLRIGGARATIRIPEDAIEDYIARVTIEPTTHAGREPDPPPAPLMFVRESSFR